MSAVQFAAERGRDDREGVLAAVKKNWRALKHASVSCRGDREIVLAAVKQDWHALHYAALSSRTYEPAESCRGDRAIVLAAVQQDSQYLALAASDELLEDSSFAVEAKQDYHILKISMISGRQAI
eukprot:914009-Amphidinium_carterae.1